MDTNKTSSMGIPRGDSMIPEKWQLYSQTGVDGPEYGVRIRPGYTVVGFQKEDAKEIIGLRDEVKRLRSENKIIADRAAHHDRQDAKAIELLAARIAELEADRIAYRNLGSKIEELETYIEMLEAAFLEAKRCPTCNGKGMIRHTVMHRVKDRMEDMSFNRTCPLCSGKGEQNAREALEGIKEGGKDE